MDDEKNSVPGYGIDKLKFNSSDSPYDRFPKAAGQSDKNNIYNNDILFKQNIERSVQLRKERDAKQTEENRERRSQAEKERQRKLLQNPSPVVGSTGTGCVLQVLLIVAFVALFTLIFQVL